MKRRRGNATRDASATSVPPVEVSFTDVAFGGDALGRLPDGRVLFAPYLLPNETGLVSVVEEHHDYARGQLQSLVSAAAERTAPPCEYFMAGCGGCSWQHASYAAQLGYKRRMVVDQLRRIGQLDGAEQVVREPIGMVQPWHYRNQARFTVGRRDGELCFTRRGSHQLLKIDHCWISHPRINAAVEHLQGRLTRTEVPRHVHQLTVRVGSNTGDLLIAPALPEIQDLQTGQSGLDEELLGVRFRLHASSFFQVNTLRELRPAPSSVARARVPLPPDGLSMAEILALLVLDRVDPRPESVVVDAYCGVGTFALLMAPFARRVIGIEEAHTAVENARFNGRTMPSVHFIEGKTENVLPQLAAEHQPDAIVLDPSRVGVAPAVLQALLNVRPATVVYVSCDPSTLARDLRILVAGGYRLKDVQPLDMFPQTFHVECVATLTC